MSLESWTYTEDDLHLSWESPVRSAFDMEPFRMKEYYINTVTLTNGSAAYRMNTPGPRCGEGHVGHRVHVGYLYGRFRVPLWYLWGLFLVTVRSR